jgi:hypothetical protein
MEPESTNLNSSKQEIYQLKLDANQYEEFLLFQKMQE